MNLYIKEKEKKWKMEYIIDHHFINRTRNKKSFGFDVKKNRVSKPDCCLTLRSNSLVITGHDIYLEEDKRPERINT